MKIKAILLSGLLAVAASGCSTQVNQANIQPQIEVEQSAQFDSLFSLNTKDLRSNQILMTIRPSGEEQVHVISSEINLRQAIDQQLKQGYQNLGLGIINESPLHLSVDILELGNHIEQQSVKHLATSTMRIKVTLKTPKQTVSKQYRSEFTQEGALKVDVAAQADRMQQQLSNLLKQIVEDPQLISILGENNA